MKAFEWKKSLPIAAVKEDMFSSVQICSFLNFQKTLVFDYGYTIKLLLTSCEVQAGKYLELSFPNGPHFIRSVIQTCGPDIFLYGPHNWSIRVQYCLMIVIYAKILVTV